MRRPLTAFALVAAITVTAAGCGGDDDKKSADGLKSVSLAMDWTPNTNHTGIAVAQKLGYYKDAGLDLKVLPYGSTSAEDMLGAHKADFGISYSEGVIVGRAAGKDLTSVYAITQKPDVEIAVKADRDDIQSPKDLDGKTYAGFGAPYEQPLLEYVIKKAGGKGDFKNVTLSTGAYEALYSNQADFAMPVPTWQMLEAKLAGKPLKGWPLSDFGAPQAYSFLIASTDSFLKKDPETAKKFVQATEKGYRYTVEHPAEAAKILLDTYKAELTNTELVKQSIDMLVKDYYQTPDGKLGVQDGPRWQQFVDFMATNGLLADAQGKKLDKAPDAATMFQNLAAP
jgi:ABC-type nitrate/sulfonate/bicarbonate transport system substrate-binding protein